MQRSVIQRALVPPVVVVTAAFSVFALNSRAEATPIGTATYLATSTTDLAAVNETLPALALGSLADVRIGRSTGGSAAQPQTASAQASNLDAALVGLNIPLQAVSQSAPADHTTAQTATFVPLNASPLLSSQLITASAQARSAVTGTCLASGAAASSATTSTAGVTVGKNVVASLTGRVGVGDVADIGALSSTGTTSLVKTSTAPGDLRAVQSQTTATVGAIALLNNAIDVKVVGTPTLTAQATGVVGTSIATYTAPAVSVSVNSGTPTSLNAEGTQNISLDTRVAGTGLVANVALSLGTIQNVVNSGTAVSAKASVVDATISLTAYAAGVPTPLTTTTLSIAPMTVSTTAPATGVQCAPAPGAPTITSPGNGSTITTNKPPIIGTATDGDAVTVTDGDGNVICETTAVTGSLFSCTPTTGLPEGTVTLTATDTGPGGASASAPVTFTVNADAPVAPVITAPSNGAVVNNATVAFTGTGVAGDTASVIQGMTVLCTALVAPSGDFHCSPTAPIGLGSHTVFATQQDPANHLDSPTSNVVTFTTTVVGTQFTPLKPYRVADTRTAFKVGPITGPITAGHTLTLSAQQLGLQNNSASAVVINLTIVTPQGSGYASAYPSDQTRPVVSSINYNAGHDRANLVIVPVSADGSITIYTNQTAHIVVDVFGYFATRLESTSGGLFHALTPSRLIDTRLTGKPLTQAATRVLPVAGHGGVPTSGVGAAVLNVTVARPTAASGYVSAFPSGTAFDGRTSNVNFVKGDLASTRVIVPLGTGGAVNIFNKYGTTQLVVDVVGYISAAGTTDVTGSHFVAVDPTRRVDTRIGTGTTRKPLGKSELRTVQVTGTATVPTAGTTAVVANLTAVTPTGFGYLSQGRAGIAKPLVSDVNFIAGDVVANLIVSGIDSSGRSAIYNSTGSVTNLVEDISGYFTVATT